MRWQLQDDDGHRAARSHAAARRGRLDRLRDAQPHAGLRLQGRRSSASRPSLASRTSPNNCIRTSAWTCSATTRRRVNLRYLGDFDWGTLEARAYHEKVDHFMDFGADKRYWYGAASRRFGGARIGTPLLARSARPVPPACRCTPRARTPASRSRRTSISATRTCCASAPNTSATGSTTGGRPPAAACGRAPSGTSTTVSVIARRCSANGKSSSTQHWMTLLGLRYERVTMDAGDVQGYNPAAQRAWATRSRDAATFNAAQDHSRPTTTGT